MAHDPARFLALTARHGWVVVEHTFGTSGFRTVPGGWSVSEELILDRAELPPIKTARSLRAGWPGK